MKLEDRLKQINIENYIFYIYFGIIILSLYANKLEKKYLIYKDNQSKEKYRHIMILIFTIAICVYLYYTYDSYTGLKDDNYSNEIKKYNNLSFFASSLVLISGLIFLYIAYNDKDLNVELAFN